MILVAVLRQVASTKFAIDKTTRQHVWPDLSDRVDIVIVGGGIGGLSSAAFLSDKLPNAKIMLIEKMPELGGILGGPFNAGGVWTPQTWADIEPLENSVDPSVNLTDMLEDFRRSVSKLEELGAVDPFQTSSSPYYYGDNKDLKATSFPNVQRSWIEWPFVALMSTVLKYGLYGGQAARNVYEGSPKGADGFFRFPGFVSRASQYVSGLGNVQTLLETEVVELTGSGSDDGNQYRFTVHARGKRDRRITIQTNHVVFASGGFAANSDIMESRNLGAMKPHSWNSINSGIMEKVAEKWEFRPGPRNIPQVWYSEAVRLPSGVYQPVLFLDGDSMMVVNKQGNRVYNEKWPYARRGEICFREGHLIAIMDGKSINERAQALWVPPSLNALLPSSMNADKFNAFLPPRQYGDRVYMHGNSIAELAEMLRNESLIDDEFEVSLQAQLDRFNEFADKGIDDDFGRHSYPVQFLRNDFAPMRRIDANDLYAVVLWPSSLDTCSGPLVDERSRVQSQSSESAVPGIYAVGNCASSITRGFYVAPGVPTASAILQSYRATKHIAAQFSH
jgi:hypothetical protein